MSRFTLCPRILEFKLSGVIVARTTNRDKEELVKHLNSLEDTDEAIIFHVDMLAEGLDVPGITGVMPFRNLKKNKLLQNLGRGTRLVDADRRRLYADEIQPKDWECYVKPFCWLIMPVLSSYSYDFKRRAQDWVSALRSEYEFDSSELVIEDNVRGPDLELEVGRHHRVC